MYCIAGKCRSLGLDIKEHAAVTWMHTHTHTNVQVNRLLQSNNDFVRVADLTALMECLTVSVCSCFPAELTNNYENPMLGIHRPN